MEILELNTVVDAERQTQAAGQAHVQELSRRAEGWLEQHAAGVLHFEAGVLEVLLRITGSRGR